MQKKLAVSPVKINLYAIINEGLLIIHIRQQKKLIFVFSILLSGFAKKGQRNPQLYEENQNCLKMGGINIL